MISFKDITKDIESDVEYFENYLRDIISTDDDFVSDFLNYIFETKGKRIRPILVYLTARMYGSPTKTTHNAAMLVEMMHTATLLHDDVVDKGVLRRGKPTVNNKWDDKTAVLVGDFLFAKTMKIATDNKEYKLFDIIAPAIMSLTTGELQQMNHPKSLTIDEDSYFDIIKKKTASLISVCCEAGSFSVNSSHDEIANMKCFGEILGVIFQIKDDVLDYDGSKSTGKEIGMDIKEQKLTLPLICAWKNMNELDRNHISQLWNNIFESPDNAKEIIELVKLNNGLTDSVKIMNELKIDALAFLKTAKKSNAKDAIIKLLDYVIDRES